MAKSTWRRHAAQERERRTNSHDGTTQRDQTGHDRYIADQLRTRCAGYYTMYDEPLPSLAEVRARRWDR